jgi:hypothetical protein
VAAIADPSARAAPQNPSPQAPPRTTLSRQAPSSRTPVPPRPESVVKQISPSSSPIAAAAAAVDESPSEEPPPPLPASQETQQQHDDEPVSQAHEGGPPPTPPPTPLHLATGGPVTATADFAGLDQTTDLSSFPSVRARASSLSGILRCVCPLSNWSRRLLTLALPAVPVCLSSPSRLHRHRPPACVLNPSPGRVLTLAKDWWCFLSSSSPTRPHRGIGNPSAHPMGPRHDAPVFLRTPAKTEAETAAAAAAAAPSSSP